MSTDPYKKNAESDRGRQQSFGPTSGLNRPFVQGLKQPEKVQPIQTNPQTQPLVNQPKSPSVASNLTKLDIRNNQKTTINSERNAYQNSGPTQPQYEPQPNLPRNNSFHLNGPKGLNQ
jgi:hypothetical protein